ncbi:MAG: hypothetical protein DMF63_07010 [Acidobacteria bacterium]|nr:MAG: hypothetical protein DMF63_07010 [Acidobacteriota bacterium]
MGSTKHEKSFVDFEQPYEQNIIGLKGVFYFGIGLVLLIIITFALMWALLNVLKEDAAADKGTSGPMAMTEIERLPPEPRLQVAPGFGVESPDGRVNMELKAPQAEYRELKKQWALVWEHGSKDARTGAVSSMPIDMAKEKFLEEAVKARSGEEAEQKALRSKMYFTDASSGRRAAEKRR